MKWDVWSRAHTRQGLFFFFLHPMRLPHATTAGFLLVQRRRRRTNAEGVSCTQVQLRREASVKHVCVQPTSVASSNTAGRDVFISQSVFASQTGHSEVVLLFHLSHGIFDPSGIEDKTQTNYWFSATPQKDHRFKTTNTFDHKTRRCRSPSGWAE